MIKQKELVYKYEISNLIKKSDLNAKLATLAELIKKEDKILKIQAFDSSYFRGKIFFCHDGLSPNT